MKKSLIFVLVFAIVLVVSLFRLGSVRLFDVDEAVFAEATKEMVESGDYITTTYNGNVRYDKPIFFYWAMALSYKVFGINEFGARFPSAFAGCLLAAALFFFVRHYCGLPKALYAVLSMVLSVYYFVYARSAVTDMMLTLFITASLFSFYLSLRTDNRFIYGFYFFSAMAFLTKGLIGILFPAVIAFIFLVVTEGLNGIGKMINVRGILLFLAVGTPWYAAEYAIRGNEFIGQFFIKHHFKRYTDVISGHKGPVYYYLVALVAGLFPWVAFLPAGIRQIFKDKDPLLVFLGIWLGFIMVFFSFATTKLPDYILSAIPAACILIAEGMTADTIRWKRAAWGFIGIISAAAGIVFLLAPAYLAQNGITDTGWMPIIAAVSLVLFIFCLYLVFTGRELYAALSSLMFIFLIVMTVTALPVASEYLQGALYRYSIYGKEHLKENERLITYGLNKPSIVFYSGHKVAVAGGMDSLQKFLDEGRGRLVFAKSKDIEKLLQLGLVLRDRSRDYALLEKE